MHESLKLNWQMRYEWYPNELYLKGFDNLLTAYVKKTHGRILDIGCGQSEYLLDLLNSEFELFAQDEEEFQLDFLRKRVVDEGHMPSRINYSTKRFPEIEFDGLFDGIVLSNVLHFYTMEEISSTILNPLISILAPDGLIVVTVHSNNHPSNKAGKEATSDFKHFFTRKDILKLFSRNHFETLLYSAHSFKPRQREIEFYKAWLKRLYNQSGILDEKRIVEAQNEYLKNSRQNSITVVLRRQ